ncbi:thioredoxin-disulfide reductase [Pseudonocardia ailaonensis]|uniref:Thioredoxin-disulfide reductase n=1 Tax=Pseudonocardia ailaonensis TaxID=367279 RepID=A0ABN2MHL1_9PSEU
MSQPPHRSVVVVGSGPAGYTAAIYAARAGLGPLVIEGAELGGALMGTGEVQNFPGFPKGIHGPELMANMRVQAQGLGVELVPEDAIGIDLDATARRVRTAGAEWTADAVVLAMGSQARTLGLPAESWAMGNGVSTCATCDGFTYRGRPVAVVGGGDAAVEEAITLARLASEVTLVHRRDTLRASRILQDELARTDVRIMTDAVVTDILGRPSVTGVLLRDLRSGVESRLAVDGLFVAVGQTPRSELVRGQVELGDGGHVLLPGPTTMTSVDGVFACGDLVDHRYRQAITAAGSGCQASLDAERWLVHSGAGGKGLR